MAGLLPDGCYTVSDAFEWAVNTLNTQGHELMRDGNWVGVDVVVNLRQKLTWGYIAHLKMLHFRNQREVSQLRATLQPFARMATLYHDGEVMKCAACYGRLWQVDEDQPRHFYGGVTFIHDPDCPVSKAQQALSK